MFFLFFVEGLFCRLRVEGFGPFGLRAALGFRALGFWVLGFRVSGLIVNDCLSRS